MSWNSFFLLIINDWRGGRSKCHCGHFTDCHYCQLLRDSGIVKSKNVKEYLEAKHGK